MAILFNDHIYWIERRKTEEIYMTPENMCVIYKRSINSNGKCVMALATSIGVYTVCSDGIFFIDRGDAWRLHKVELSRTLTVRTLDFKSIMESLDYTRMRCDMPPGRTEKLIWWHGYIYYEHHSAISSDVEHVDCKWVKVSANSGSFTYEAPPEEALIQRDVWIDTEDINSRNILGRTCLIDAAEFADAATLSTLIKLGVDVNAQDRNGMTALMMAANNNNSPTVISVLVQAGADVNTKDELGLTALDCALKKGTQYRDQHLDRPYTKFFFNQEINLDVVAELIKLGADVDVQDTVGMTALMMASYHNNHKLVSMLIKANADANIKDKFGLTALDCALKKETQYRDENRDFQYYWPGWEPNQEIDPNIVAELIKVTDIEMGCDHNSGVDTMVYNAHLN